MSSATESLGTLTRLGHVALGAPFVTPEGHSTLMSELAYLHNHPEHPGREMVQGYCSQGCGAMFQVMRFFEHVTGCEECRAKKIEADRVESCRKAWEDLCPELYRKTYLKHPHFPKAQHELTKGFLVIEEPKGPDDQRSELQRTKAGKSYVFFGPSRAGKTRLAFVLLKRAMHFAGQSVGVMFDDDLNAAKADRERALSVKKWAGFDVLLLDDALLTGAQDEATTSFLKSLLEKIMNRERHVIITTQITKEEYRAQLSKWDSSTKKTTAADSERTGALLARIQEMCGDPIEFHAIPGTEAPKPTAAAPIDETLPF